MSLTTSWRLLSQSWQFIHPFLSLRTVFLVIILANIKSVHFMWHFRFLRALIRRLTDPAPTKHLSPVCLFLPAISTSRSPLLECDYNMHKSNSTYFTDLDISRGNLTLILFRKPFNPFPGPANCIIVLGGAQCVWRKEILPYQRYELWTRVLSWDEKWIYLISHFVRPGMARPGRYVMQPKGKGWRGWGGGKGKERGMDGGDDAGGGKGRVKEPQKAVFASAVARYVFKNQRRTVAPEKMLRECGLLPTDRQELEEVERLRLKWLDVAQLKAGWDEVHGLFEGGDVALGRYTDVWWR